MGDPLERYKASDIVVDGTVTYHGRLTSNGWWYILKEDSADGSYRYARGRSGYADAWADRANLTYGLFSVIWT